MGIISTELFRGDDNNEGAGAARLVERPWLVAEEDTILNGTGVRT